MTDPILVTGASGRLGRALQRVDGGRHQLIAVGGPRAKSFERRLDITDAAAVRRIVADVRPRVVIHLASVLGPVCERDEELAERVNVAGTRHIATAAQEFGVVRLVFASTAAVYGTRRRHPLAESDAVEPRGTYATTKVRAEQALFRFSDTLSIDVMRVFNVYGPEMSDSLVSRLEHATVASPVRLTGLDGFVRDYVHVDDVARAFLAAANSASEGSRLLNVGSGVPRSNRELLELVPPGKRSSVTVETGHDSYSCADITAIVRELSWRPTEPWPPFGGS